jgi:glycosyltransferase involved in cell wall biosynthesis
VRVSVVIPVYNKAPFLKECFQSVFEQTYSDFELIAIDDRSTDDSLAVLRSFRDPRLRIIALDTNLGPAGAAQRGINIAQGEYIVRLDADDVMFRDRIERQVEFMDSEPRIGASGGQVVLFGEDTRTVEYPLGNDACKADLLFGVPMSQGASILRTSVLHASGIRYKDEWPRVAEDWLFFIELAAHTRFGNMDVPLIRYRRGGQNIKKGQDMDRLRVEILNLALPKLGLIPDQRNMFNHCLNIPVFGDKVDRKMVREYRDWLDEVLRIHSGLTLFPPDALSPRIERAWKDLFHYLPDHGFAPALEHMRLSRSWPSDRLLYMLKVRIASLLKRSAKP